MNLTIKGEKRETSGKNASRRIRKQGKVPAVLYGPNIGPYSLTLDKADIFAILKSESGENSIFKVSFDSGQKNVMIKEFQSDPVTDELLHVDLIQIAMDKMIRVTVPILLTGEAVGVKSEGGFVEFATREIEVECLPGNIPEQISVDISPLHLHQSIKVEDLTPPENVEIISDENTMIVLIEAPTKEEIVEEVEAEEEMVAEEEEPEVIKKERGEEEEEKKE